MTVDTIYRLKALVDEVVGTGSEIVTAWEYINVYNHKTMFAAFIPSCFCDIFESPAVSYPICIYQNGKWRGEYRYLNRQ